MCNASIVLLAVLFVAATAGVGCELTSVPDELGLPGDGLPSNDLRDYVLTHYSGNGGSVFGHLKMYGNLFVGSLTDEEKIWLASHYDIVDHGSPDFPELAKQVNPLILTTTHFNSSHLNREEIPSPLEAWVDSPENTAGYALDDLLINYREGVVNRCGSFAPGDLMPVGNRCDWYTHDLAGDSWREFAVQELERQLQLGTPVARDGIMFDVVSFVDDGMGWDKSEEYWGLDPATEDHPRIAHVYETVGYLHRQLDARLPGLRIYISNIGNTTWLTNPNRPLRKALAQQHAANIQDESWVVVNSLTPKPRDVSSYEMTLVSPIRDFLRRGHGYMFETGDRQDTDRGKRFTLGMFYLVNHPLAFYWYRDMGVTDGEALQDWMWNRYVEVDVGQPVQNFMSIPDWEGRLSTEHFVWQEAETYRLLAREYERALVVVKLMARNETPGQSPTSHDLPAAYQPVLEDLTLGEPVTTVTLVNNDAVILVKP